MKCPWCVSDGERSTLEPLLSASTLMAWSPYYDEDGSYHSHDPNGGGSLFLCSRGHRWVAEYRPCPSCEWGVKPARLIETRCAGSGEPCDAATPQPCPECDQDVHVNGFVEMDASREWRPTTYRIGTHFIRVESGDAGAPSATQDESGSSAVEDRT